MLELQTLELENSTLSEAQQEQARTLRGHLPAKILERFDRWIARSKRAVAVVRGGVCSECHLRLPSGTLGALARTAEVQSCDNCGRYLYLSPDEPLDPSPSSPPVPQSSRKRGRKLPAERAASRDS